MADDPHNRDSKGRFGAGNVANPGGRPKMSDGERSMLADGCVKSVKTLCDALDAEKVVFVEGTGDRKVRETVPDWTERIKAACALLDRRYGKSPQAITGEDGAPFVGVVILPPSESDAG